MQRPEGRLERGDDVAATTYRGGLLATEGAGRDLGNLWIERCVVPEARGGLVGPVSGQGVDVLASKRPGQQTREVATSVGSLWRAVGGAGALCGEPHGFRRVGGVCERDWGQLHERPVSGRL